MGDDVKSGAERVTNKQEQNHTTGASPHDKKGNHLLHHVRHKKTLLRQHVIVMRGCFAAQEFLVLDLDIMVEVHVNTKE